MKILLRIFLFLCIFMVHAGAVCAQNNGRTKDRAVYEKVHGTLTDRSSDSSTDLGSRPMGELVLAVAKTMLGTPYVASLLETEPESLQIILDRTDCMLFVETCTAMALTFKGLEIVQGGTPVSSEPSFELFCRNVQNLRYRGGVIDGYPSRLHYTSEWIQQAQANGILAELTADLGERRAQKFSFMSTHPQSYRQLKDSPENRKLIQETELELGYHGPYHFVSQRRLSDPSVAAQIKDGDILAFVSNVEGLDVTHVAIACTVDGKMHFIHASTSSMKVIVEPKTLAEYAKAGVRIIRLN